MCPFLTPAADMKIASGGITWGDLIPISFGLGEMAAPGRPSNRARGERAGSLHAPTDRYRPRCRGTI